MAARDRPVGIAGKMKASAENLSRADLPELLLPPSVGSIECALPEKQPQKVMKPRVKALATAAVQQSSRE